MNEDDLIQVTSAENKDTGGRQRTAMNSIRGVRLSPISTTKPQDLTVLGFVVGWLDHNFDQNLLIPALILNWLGLLANMMHGSLNAATRPWRRRTAQCA
jgi:hypothetical protein